MEKGPEDEYSRENVVAIQNELDGSEEKFEWVLPEPLVS